MTTATVIGLDLAKNVFQVHGASMAGELKFRKRLSRMQFRKFIARHPRATVVMEAFDSAHYWGREIARYGHGVKLIAPQYVRPFVKRQKNDATDADAIVVAAQRPEMRFIMPKAEEQQAQAIPPDFGTARSRVGVRSYFGPPGWLHFPGFISTIGTLQPIVPGTEHGPEHTETCKFARNIRGLAEIISASVGSAALRLKRTSWNAARFTGQSARLILPG